jgi:hypothetical protein
VSALPSLSQKYKTAAAPGREASRRSNAAAARRPIMTMATIWTKAKEDAARRLGAEPIGGDQLARRLLAGFSGGLSKQLDAFEAATKLADMQKTAQPAKRTMNLYGKHLTGMRQTPLSPAAVKVLNRTKEVLVTLEELIDKRVTKLHQAAGNAEMAFGSMRTYWQQVKRKIEADVKASRDKADISGVRSLLADFDGGLGKELQAFEAAFPDLLRMKQSKTRIAVLIQRYRASIEVKQRIPDDKKSSRTSEEHNEEDKRDEHQRDGSKYSDRVQRAHQLRLIAVLKMFQVHIDKLVEQIEKQAADAWLRAPAG